MLLSRTISPELPLRLGLGLMYLYSGQDIFLHPRSWTWALPNWFARAVQRFVTLDTYLRLQGTAEIVIALAFLAWFLKPSVLKYFAALSLLEILGILFLSPLDAFSITFRDLGILGAVCTLFIICVRKERAENQSTA